jgi:type IV pilus assembly protein PilA
LFLFDGLLNLERGQQGYTLIELLSAMAIIAILAAIAVPQYSGYRQGGFDGRAQADLHNVATAEEAYYADNQSYIGCTQDDCSTLLPGLGPLSQGVIIEVVALADGFTAIASHPQGSGREFTWSQ